MNMQDQIEKIGSHEDLARFVDGMRLSLEKGEQKWENRDLISFLEAMAAWITDMDGYFQNIGEPCPEPPHGKQLLKYLRHPLCMSN